MRKGLSLSTNPTSPLALISDLIKDFDVITHLGESVLHPFCIIKMVY